MATRTAPGYAERRWEPIVDARTGPGWCRSLAQVGCKREVGTPGGLQRGSHARCLGGAVSAPPVAYWGFSVLSHSRLSSIPEPGGSCQMPQAFSH